MSGESLDFRFRPAFRLCLATGYFRCREVFMSSRCWALKATLVPGDSHNAARSSRSVLVFARIALKQSSQYRLGLAKPLPSWGITTQLIPPGILVLQRLHLLAFFTGIRRGAPRVLPISDGTGPLGLPLLIFFFCLPDASRERLNDIVKRR